MKRIIIPLLLMLLLLSSCSSSPVTNNSDDGSKVVSSDIGTESVPDESSEDATGVNSYTGINYNGDKYFPQDDETLAKIPEGFKLLGMTFLDTEAFDNGEDFAVVSTLVDGLEVYQTPNGEIYVKFDESTICKAVKLS